MLVLKPALSGAGFEADRGACGTLKYRCPAAAFGCAGREECHRARLAVANAYCRRRCAGREECHRARLAVANAYCRRRCAGREECHRARQAGEPSASTSMTVGFSRRPLGQPLLEAGTAVPPRICSRVDNAYRMEKHYRRCLRLGLVTVAATALGCLRAERQGGRWLARSGCTTDRGGPPTAPPKLAACVQAATRVRSDRTFSLRSEN